MHASCTLAFAAAAAVACYCLLAAADVAMNTAACLDDHDVAAVADMLQLPLAYAYQRARV